MIPNGNIKCIKKNKYTTCPYFTKIWQFYNVSENIIDQYDDIDAHIDTCKNCQRRYDKLVENDLSMKSKIDEHNTRIKYKNNSSFNHNWKKIGRAHV